VTGSIENDRRVFALDKVSSDATRALVANLKSGETPGEMEAHWEAVNAMWREIGESGGPEALEKSLGAIVDRLLHEKGIRRVTAQTRSMLCSRAFTRHFKTPSRLASATLRVTIRLTPGSSDFRNGKMKQTRRLLRTSMVRACPSRIWLMDGGSKQKQGT
jgi:hypothetical protein